MVKRRGKRWSKKAKKLSWQEALKKIYISVGQPDALTSSPKRLQIQLLKRYKISGVSLTQIKEWLHNQYSYSMHKRAPVQFKRNPILVANMDDQWQADLLFLDNLGKFNEGMKIILIVIDVVSRFMWVEPMKTKTGVSTTAAFEAILERASPRKPKKLQTDKGTEFLNSTFQSMLSKHGIDFFTTYSDMKAAIAERAVQTLKVLIHKYIREHNTKYYMDKLQDIVTTYNRSYHSATKYAPADISEENVHHVLNNLYGFLWEKDLLRAKPPRFKVGDYVRVSKVRSHPFRKSYLGNWTEEIFQISKVIETVPKFTYKIKDLKNGSEILGSYYDEDMLKVSSEHHYWNIEKIIEEKQNAQGKKMFLVKWEGHDESHNSWISEDQLKNE